MSRFRQRIGESGCELILQATVAAGLNSNTIKPAHLKRVTVDTTVQEKAVSFPTDSKLLNRSRVRLVKLCHKHGVVLRQSYARKGPQALFKANRYGHARQMRRMRSRVKKLHIYLGRVVRDIERKMAAQPERQAVFAAELVLAKRLLVQHKQDKTSCTACMLRKWNASVRARRISAMSLGSRRVLRPPTRATLWWVVWPCRAILMMVTP